MGFNSGFKGLMWKNIFAWTSYTLRTDVQNFNKFGFAATCYVNHEGLFWFYFLSWYLSPLVLHLSSVNNNNNNNSLFVCFVCFWRNSPQWVMASSFTRFLDHTQRRTTVGRTPLDEWSARCRDLYLTTHNTHDRHSCPRWDSNPQSQQASGGRSTP